MAKKAGRPLGSQNKVGKDEKEFIKSLLGETQEQFETRLREQYCPQIMLYREILQRMGLGEVKEMYLCAIALHGVMIRLGV